MCIRLSLTLLVTALTCSAIANLANAAARDRVFVASYGNDANPCTFLSPCKTFQQAVNVVAAGGEVTAIDSAGFGPITITQAITITSPDGVEAGIVTSSGGNAITINAGLTDAVVLRGLTLNGSGGGANGVIFNSGGSLTVTNCVVQNFIWNGSSNRTGNGILIQPASGAVNFVITNTIAANNGLEGISYLPQSGSANANGVIDHVTVTNNNASGISVFTPVTTGITAVAISNSVSSNNSAEGIFISGGSGPLTVSIDNAAISNNQTGIFAQDGTVFLGRSTVTHNTSANVVNSAGITFFSYKNNQFDQSIGTLLNTTLGLQ